jgi:hypothetical protein
MQPLKSRAGTPVLQRRQSMILKIYVVLWMLLALAAGFVAITGNFTYFAATVIGFISMPLIFAGMIIIVPGTFMHAPDKEEIPKQPRLKTKLKELSERTKDTWAVTDMTARKLS